MLPAILEIALSLIIASLELVSGGHFFASDYGIREDPLGYDPNLQVAHLYKTQWPVGIAVSRTGRKFASFPSSFDDMSTNTGRHHAYQVGELTGFDKETPYPNVSINSPPGGPVDFSQSPPVTKGLRNYLIRIEAVVIDSSDRLWLLDAGRVSLNGTLLAASPGGAKLVLIDLATDAVTQIYMFPTTVAKPNSYFDDVRFDVERHYAYITDFSDETQDNAIVVVNLKTGQSWRTLEKDPTVMTIYGTVPFVLGEPLCAPTSSGPGFIIAGASGIALSNDTEILYYSVIAGRFLYSIPTALLRDRNTPASQIATSVRHLGEKGISDSIVSDSLGIVYGGNVEQSGISMYNPTTGRTVLFVRDKRIIWVDAMSVGEDGYLYFTSNQANYLPKFHSGVDARQRPFVLFRARLPRPATKGLGS